LENNYGDQDMTGSYLAHSNLPPNRSLAGSNTRSPFTSRCRLTVFEPKILEIFDSEIRPNTLDYLLQGPQIHLNFLFVIVLRP
jgi:hypothetical protein